MNCRRTRSLLSAYIDGELTGYEMLAMRDHIAHCRECRDEHYSFKTIKSLLSALPDKQPSAEWAALLAESLAQGSPSVLARLWAQWGRSLDAAAASLELRNRRMSRGALASVFMASLIGLFLYSFNRQGPQAPADPFASPAPSTASVVPNPLGQPTGAAWSGPREQGSQYIAVQVPTGALPTAFTSDPFSRTSFRIDRNGFITNPVRPSSDVAVRPIVPNPAGMPPVMRNFFMAPWPDPQFWQPQHVTIVKFGSGRGAAFAGMAPYTGGH